MNDEETVLQHVVRSDKTRCKLQEDFDRAYHLPHPRHSPLTLCGLPLDPVINSAIESAVPLRMHRALAQLALDHATQALDDANDLAARRSGARGKAARARQLDAEREFAEALRV